MSDSLKVETVSLTKTERVVVSGEGGNVIVTGLLNSPLPSDPPGTAAAAIAAHTAASDPHPQYTTNAEVIALIPVQSVAGKTGIVSLAKTDVGLSNVEDKSSATIRGEITSSNVTTALGFTPENPSNKGAANGYASLDSGGKVPSTQLPSYVDDILEYANLAAFPATGETGKIYVALDTNKTYRWSGSAYISIYSGAVDSVAGKTGVVTLVKADVGLGNVDDTSDLNKPISTATQTALDAKQATLVSGTNIKTVGGVSILGTGDIPSSSISVAANNGLALAANVLSTIYNTTMSDAVSSTAVGGAAAALASVWKTKTIVQVLDTILFPDLDPTYTLPTFTHTLSVTGNQEIGSTINQLISATVTENDQGIATTIDFRRGTTTVNTVNSPSGTSTTDVPAQYGYASPNNPNLRYTPTYTDSFVVTSGSTTWQIRAAMNAGLPKQNNKGVTDARAAGATVNTPQAARALASTTSTASGITGLYPYFWGKSSTQPTAASIASAIQAGTATKVLADATGTVIITYDAAAEYIWLAHIATATSKTKWYNTALNNGNIGAGQFILAPVTQNVTSPQGYWTAQSFKIYISSGATNTSGAIEYRNT